MDPPVRTLKVFRLQAKDWLQVSTFTGNQRVRAEPFEAIELDLPLLWSR